MKKESRIAASFNGNDFTVFKAEVSLKVKTYALPTQVCTAVNPVDGIEYVVKRIYTVPEADWEVLHPF